MDAWLVVVMVVVPVLLIAGNVYILIYFQDEEDKWTSWIPKVLVVSGLTISEICVLMLPLDVNNRGPPAGDIPMGTLWLIMYIALPVFGLVILPFDFFWYDAESTADEKFPTALRLRRTFVSWLVLLFIFAALYIIGYIFFGVAEVKTQKLSGAMRDFYASVSTTACGSACNSISSYTDIRISPILFLVTVFTFIGYAFLVIFGSIGLVALPWDLFLDYLRRPKRITADQYARGREDIGHRADQLHEIGLRIQERRRMGSVGRKERQQYHQWRQSTIILEEDYARLKDAYELKGFKLLIAYLKLPTSIFFTILTIAWLLHILLYLIIPTPPTTFLNAMFTKLNDAWGLLGTVAYAIFSFYMLLCVIKGVFKFGMRFFFFIPVFPMKIGETLMNAFLFNVILIIISAITVTQFCTSAFKAFTHTTSVNQIFVLSIGELRILKYYYKYFPFGFIGLPFLVFAYLMIRPWDVPSTAIVSRA